MMASKQTKKSYFRTRANSFKYAFNGIFIAIISEANIKIHIIAASLVTAMAIYFRISNAEWILLILTMGFVISAELFNSAIESLTDLVSPGQNTIAGKVKDIAAGAVLVSAIAAAIIGLLIFLPKIISLF